MLNVAQKAMLVAFGHIIANIEPRIGVSVFLFSGQETFKLTVSDGWGGWFDFEGHGSTLDEAFEKVCGQFEAHTLGTKRENVQTWIDAGCPGLMDEAPDTVRQPLLLDLSAFNEEDDIDIDVRPAVIRVPGGTRAKDMDPGPGRRWVKETNQRNERRLVKTLLRNNVD